MHARRSNVQRLQDAGFMIKKLLPQEYEEVIEDLTPGRGRRCSSTSRGVSTRRQLQRRRTLGHFTVVSSSRPLAPVRSTRLTSSERLRLKVELAAPALALPGRILLDHPRARELFPVYLATATTLTRTMVPLMETALARARELAPHDPVAEGLAEYLERHIPEEMHSDEPGGAMLDDLEALGVDPVALQAQPPPPEDRRPPRGPVLLDLPLPPGRDARLPRARGLSPASPDGRAVDREDGSSRATASGSFFCTRSSTSPTPASSTVSSTRCRSSLATSS